MPCHPFDATGCSSIGRDAVRLADHLGFHEPVRSAPRRRASAVPLVGGFRFSIRVRARALGDARPLGRSSCSRAGSKFPRSRAAASGCRSLRRRSPTACQTEELYVSARISPAQMRNRRLSDMGGPQTQHQPAAAYDTTRRFRPLRQQSRASKGRSVDELAEPICSVSATHRRKHATMFPRCPLGTDPAVPFRRDDARGGIGDPERVESTGPRLRRSVVCRRGQRLGGGETGAGRPLPLPTTPMPTGWMPSPS